MILSADTRIAHYQLIRLIGSGSSGEVWEAHDGVRSCAIKFLRLDLLESEMAEKHKRRFFTEIRVLERMVNVLNIPRLYGYDLTCERPYLVMQFVDSTPFDTLINTGEIHEIPLPTRLEMLGKIARALNTLHAEGFVHRDVKPANIAGIETPYLLDFSIVLYMRDRPNDESSIGTPIYLPPPDIYHPDTLTDSYAFAILAYEVIFGEHPIFQNQDYSKMNVLQTRQRAADILRSQRWRKPSTLANSDALPRSLTGANLVALDTAFNKGFGEYVTRYKDLTALIDDLRQAIMIPENEAYVHFQPMARPLQDESAPTKKQDFTVHEVSQAQTNHPTETRSKWRNAWLWGILLVIVGVALWAIISTTISP